MCSIALTLEIQRQEDSWSSLASQSFQTSECQIERGEGKDYDQNILREKGLIKTMRMNKEDTSHQPVTATYVCTSTHAYIMRMCIGGRETESETVA